MTWPTGGCDLPPLPDSVAYITESGKRTVADVLAEARDAGRVALQPRCGVGDHDEMAAVLQHLDREGRADVLTLTIDSHTRLGHFEQAARALNRDPRDLNGYPLVAHGWKRGRQLNELVEQPLEVRHGSPDPRALFAVAIASGITSFEGGGISYNLPYAKDVPLEHSLAVWREVDERTGELAELGVIVDRELFGTLTAVLVPPSISLAISVIEATAAAAAGVRCLSVSYPQGGHLAQDVAALRAIPLLARRYLPPEVTVHAVLHEFMGVFPRQRHFAEQVIFYGALVARLGGAAKLVTKTYQEALGIPSPDANAQGLRLADIANSPLLDFVTVDEDAVAEELTVILEEVAEIVEPVLERPVLADAVVQAFATGRLDIPFSASQHASSLIVPRRDEAGAIRYLDWGNLPLSAASRRRNLDRLKSSGDDLGELMRLLQRDIDYFPHLFGELLATRSAL